MKGLLFVGLTSFGSFVTIILIYVIMIFQLMNSFTGLKLIISLTSISILTAFTAVYPFHAGMAAFRKIIRYRRMAERGLEICV